MCCSVCPNRANVAIEIPGMRNRTQIIHLDALCNECGNCEVFCPLQGKPHAGKLTLFEDEESFLDSKNPGFAICRDMRLFVREPSGAGSNPAVRNAIDSAISAIKSSHAYLLPWGDGGSWL
jgi:hypothetical protein